MRTNEANNLKIILQHKEYFDQKLINIITHQEEKLKSLEISNYALKTDNKKHKSENTSLKSKVKTLSNKNSNLNKSLSKSDKEKDDSLEELRKLRIQIEEIQKEVDKQSNLIKKQEEEIEKQHNIIKKLKHKNSTNSNMPSSTDILSRTKTRAQANTRVQTGRKRGGQVNHPVHKSKVISNPNRIINLTVKKAPGGAAAHKDENGNIDYYATQTIDLITKSEVTETRYFINKKGTELREETLKKYAVNPVIYTPHFKASVVYLNQKGTIPLKRLCSIMNDISRGSIKLSEGTIAKWCLECHKKSKDVRENLLNEILNHNIVGVDETGAKTSGNKHWIHVLTNDLGAYFFFTQTRGDKENGPIHYLENYSGVTVHDHFSSYQTLELCVHAECNAHIDRYLKCGIDFDHSEECSELLDLLHKMLHRKHELIKSGMTSMPGNEIQEFENKYIEIINKGIRKYEEEHPNSEKKYQPEYYKTFKRMKKYQEDHLRFIKNFEVPYTNNSSEKQCRVVKAKSKTSGQFVTVQGGEVYTSLLTLLQTSQIRKENALETLEKILQ